MNGRMGLRSLDLIAELRLETTAILFVDAADRGLAAGAHRFFAPRAVESRKLLAGISTHEGDVLRVLELARQTGARIPQLLVMGIQPQSVALEAQLIDYAAAVARQLAENAPSPRERQHAERPQASSPPEAWRAGRLRGQSTPQR